MRKLYVCEKPSQARTIASALNHGGTTPTLPPALRGASAIPVPDGIVVHGVGHIIGLANPDDYDPELKAWRLDTLPIAPTQWKYRELSDRRDVIGALQRVAQWGNHRPEGPFTEVIVATDPGQEGELIGREILEWFGWHNATKLSRLWTTAMTPEGIRQADADRQPLAKYGHLADAAKARSRADWLVGMNLTRLFSKKAGGQWVNNRPPPPISIGRVQSPMLGLIVKRKREIDGFKPREYFEIELTATTPDGRELTLRGEPDPRVYDPTELQGAIDAASGWTGPVTVTTEDHQSMPPPPFDLAGLQIKAAEALQWKADKTLAIAQALYEQHGAITYPRTGAAAWAEAERGDCMALAEKMGLRAGDEGWHHDAAWSDAAVGTEDHTAIRPTGGLKDPNALTGDERALYQMITNRFAQQFAGAWEYTTTTVSCRIGDQLYSRTDRRTRQEGWRSLEPRGQPAPDGRSSSKQLHDAGLPDGEAVEIAAGTIIRVTQALTTRHRTRAPKALTHGTLIALVKRLGLGTPATRANILETLHKRGYVKSDRRTRLIPTDRGNDLIRAIERHAPKLSDPEWTAAQERRLAEIRNGEATREAFERDARRGIEELVDRLRDADLGRIAAPPARVRESQPRGKPTRETTRRKP